LTEWPEFRGTDWRQVRQVVAVPVVFDGRNCLDERAILAEGFEYYGVGRPSSARKEVHT